MRASAADGAVCQLRTFSADRSGDEANAADGKTDNAESVITGRMEYLLRGAFLTSPVHKKAAKTEAVLTAFLFLFFAVLPLTKACLCTVLPPITYNNPYNLPIHPKASEAFPQYPHL